MMEEQAEKEMFKCYICNEAEFPSRQQLGAHQGHCKVKHPDRIERTKRIPFGVPTQRFSPPPEDGFQYRVINDNWKKEPGRVQRALSAGWEMVEHERSGENVGTNEDGSEVKLMKWMNKSTVGNTRNLVMIFDTFPAVVLKLM
jgi:hypothetical protein